MVLILSYEEEYVKYVADPKNLVIVDILNTLKKLAREKLTRVGLKILRNLSVNTGCVSLMIDNNLIGFLSMEMRKNIKDEKMKENMNFLVEIMEKNYKIFSSYEKYLKEVETEKLNFGPCHTAKFWKEHIQKTEKDEFLIIKKLIHLLDSSDETTQAVACFDLGEFSRLHPYSKKVLESFDGKTKLMKMIEKESPLVREQALVAIQKLMINNWQIIA
jgi:V-type H+-transporting ATPase subunit H